MYIQNITVYDNNYGIMCIVQEIQRIYHLNFTQKQLEPMVIECIV